MAVSHQSGVILNHWNDIPTTAFVKNKSAASSTTSLGLPSPPATPSQEVNEILITGLNGLLSTSTRLTGRNKDMIFTRIQTLIKSIQAREVPVSQTSALEEIVRNVERGEPSLAREGVVKLMGAERGIASWATALRMVIENLA